MLCIMKVYLSLHGIGLKFLASLTASIFQSVNTLRGYNLFSMEYISYYRSNLVKDVHQCFHEIFLRNILPSSPINCPNFILWHINLHSSNVPWIYVHKAPGFFLNAIRNQMNILRDRFGIGYCSCNGFPCVNPINLGPLFSSYLILFEVSTENIELIQLVA